MKNLEVQNTDNELQSTNALYGHRLMTDVRVNEAIDVCRRPEAQYGDETSSRSEASERCKCFYRSRSSVNEDVCGSTNVNVVCTGWRSVYVRKWVERTAGARLHQQRAAATQGPGAHGHRGVPNRLWQVRRKSSDSDVNCMLLLVSHVQYVPVFRHKSFKTVTI